jgi:tetratricopeptide (TPR) repeat protein
MRYTGGDGIRRSGTPGMVVSGGRQHPSVHIIGVSIPRSGHNFVVRMLQALLPLDLFYCEFYDVRGCCQAVPCARRGALPITFQKTHDFELNVPTDVPGALYLILHRAPVPAVLSARELYADDYGDEVAADRGEYAVWLGRNAEYYVTFTERWIQNPPPHSVLIDYDDVSRDPAAALKQVLGAAGIAAEERAIDEAVAKTVPHGGLFGERAYVPRSIEKSKYLDRDLVAVYESIIVDHLPGLAAQRVFPPVAYRETVTWGVFEALRIARAGHTDEAIGRLDRLAETAPDNALLHYERAALLQLQRRFSEARDVLLRAAALFPTHRPILEASVTVSLAAGDAAAVVEPMERLAALAEPTLTSRLRLALVRTHGGDATAADDVLAEVQRELPDDADVWRSVSEIRRTRGELDEALAAIETAIRTAPLHAELYAYQGELLLELGRPQDAVNALRAALVIDARECTWWERLIDAHLSANDDSGALAAINEALEQFPSDDVLCARLDELRRRAPQPPDPSERHRRQIARLEIQVSQLRAALGVAERRLYEVEVTKQRQLEESWEQTHRLDEALTEKEQAMKTAWARAHQLTAELKEREEAMREAWARARQLTAELREKDRAMQEAWTHAQRLDDALRENERALQTALAQARRLDEALQEKERAMQEAWAQAKVLDAARARLRAALDELTEESVGQPAPEAPPSSL